MPQYVRVKDKETGHEYTVLEHRVAESHTVLDKPALGADRLPARTKFKTTVAKKASGRKPATAAAENGQQADTEGDK